MASNNTMLYVLHVLLVDHEREDLTMTVNLLQMCRYSVTLIEHASAALSILSSGITSFDVVMVNVDSPDLHGMKLLEHAVSINLPTLVLSGDDNMTMVLRALASGAFLYVKKPLTLDMAKYMWQYVLREKTRPMLTTTVNRNRFLQGRDDGTNNNVRQENPNKNNGRPNKNSRVEEGDSSSVKKKACTEWTQDLHNNFMTVVQRLGEGRCFPKDILDLMNVPGLTRMQVASHLQKCRNNDWRLPEDRRISQRSNGQPRPSGGSGQPRPRQFGSMPHFGRLGAGASGGGERVATSNNNGNNMDSHVNNNFFTSMEQGESSNNPVQARESNNHNVENDQISAGVAGGIKTGSESAESSHDSIEAERRDE